MIVAESALNYSNLKGCFEMARGGARVGAGRPKGSVKSAAPKVVTSAKAKAKAKKPAARNRAATQKPSRHRVDLPGAVVPTVATGSDPAVMEQKTPLEYMLNVMNDPSVDGGRRDRMAVAAAVYLHSKQGEKGVKANRNAAAKIAGTGKFAPSAPPRLVSNNR